MNSELLAGELGGIIRRLEHRIKTTPRYAQILEQDSEDESLAQTLGALEDAICGLVMLHIQLRRNQ